METAYLFISHDLSTVRYLSHRVAVMYLGMIVELGTAKELFSHPRHPYSVGLLSSVLLPNPKLKRESAVDLAGEIPSPIDLPTGCYLAGAAPSPTTSAQRDAAARHRAEGTLTASSIATRLRGHDALDYFDDFRQSGKLLGAAAAEGDRRRQSNPSDLM